MEEVTIYEDEANQCFWFWYKGVMYSAPWHRHPYTTQSVLRLEEKLYSLGVPSYKHEGGELLYLCPSEYYDDLYLDLKSKTSVVEGWTNWTPSEED